MRLIDASPMVLKVLYAQHASPTLGEGGALCATCLPHPKEKEGLYAQHASLTP